MESNALRYFFSSGPGLLACFLITKTSTTTTTKIFLQIHTCTVEGAAQTNLSAVLPFWIAEE